MKLSDIIVTESVSRRDLSELMGKFHISEFDANKIINMLGYKSKGKNPKKLLEQVNVLIKGSGVETAISKDKKEVAIFINMGSMNNTTIIFDTMREEFFIMPLDKWSKKADVEGMDIK